MRHDPSLMEAARAIHPLECSCSVCRPNRRFAEAFGWLTPWSAPIHALGFAAAAVAVLLIPGRYLLVLVWPFVSLGLGLGR